MFTSPPPEPGVLFALARGLGVGGVNVWAMRLARALARGCDGVPPRPVTVLAHPEEPDHQPMDGWLWPGIRIVRMVGVPRIDECNGDLSPFIPTYRAEAERLAALTGRPAILVPGLHGDCFGCCAELARTMGDRVRILGVCHSSIPYDRVVINRYEPVLSGIIAVSDEIERSLRAAIPARARDIENLPHGVEAPEHAPTRRPGAADTRPLRLIYTGRMEHGLKRVAALPLLSMELDHRGINHQMVLVGDGPASSDIDRMLLHAPSATRSPAISPSRIPGVLREADIFILSSRVEGLSVSMLEAMAQGCVPVCTPTKSGASQLVTPGVTGEIAKLDTPDGTGDASDEQVASALADAVERVLRGSGESSLRALGERAWARVLQTYTLDRQARAFARIARVAAAAPARWWPGAQPAAFSGIHGCGSVPPDALDRMVRLLASLPGRRVAVHGAGAHTLALAPALRDRAEVIGFTDDDPARRGHALLGKPIVAPAAASKPRPEGLAATDVIISSWMHESDIWARRAVYERQGLRVHRLYGVDPVRTGVGGSGPCESLTHRASVSP